MTHRHSYSSAAWMIAQPLLMNVVSIPATAYIIHTLGALRYGQWAAGAALVAAVGWLPYLGLRTIYVQLVAQDESAAREELPVQMALRIALAGGAGGLAVIVATLLGYPPVVVGCVLLAAVGLVMMAAGSVLADVMQGTQRLKPYARIQLAAGLSVTAATVYAVWRGGGAAMLAAAYLVAPLISLALMALAVHRAGFAVRAHWDAARSKLLLRRARALGVMTVVASVVERSEQILAPKLAGISAFGYFAAGIIPADRLMVVPDGFTSAFQPVIARSWKERPGDAKRQAALLLRAVLLVCVPVALLTTAISRPLAELLFRERAVVCYQVIRITIWSVPLAGMAMAMRCTLYASGRYGQAAKAAMAGQLAGLVLALPLIWRFGIAGACWSWLGRAALLALFLLPAVNASYPGIAAMVFGGHEPAAKIATDDRPDATAKAA